MLPNCPRCGHELILKDGKYGWFLGCPNFSYASNCKYGLNLPPDIQKELDQDPDIELDFTGLLPKTGCPECSGHLVLRHGEFGYFHGCLEYPKCKYTVEIPVEPETDYLLLEMPQPEPEPQEDLLAIVDVICDVRDPEERKRRIAEIPPKVEPPEPEPKPEPELPKTDVRCPHCDVRVKFEVGWGSFMYRCVRNGCHKWEANADGSFKIDQIYGLYDTRPGKEGLRYIGQTATPLKKRLVGHLNDSRKKGATDPRSIWIKEMRDEGCRPDIKQLEEVPSVHKDISEQMWMSVALDCGIDITNRVIGGINGSWVFSDRLEEMQRLRDHERYLGRCEKAEKEIVLAVDLPPEVATWLEHKSFQQDSTLPARKTKSDLVVEAILMLAALEGMSLLRGDLT